MANSYSQVVANGVTTNFSVPFPYLDVAHVSVYVDDEDTEFTWSGASTVVVSPAPTSGLSVRVQRHTPTAAALHTFADHVVDAAAATNLVTLQMLYIGQELEDEKDLTLRLPYGSPAASSSIPTPEPGLVLMGNEDGTGYVYGPSAAQIEDAEAYRDEAIVAQVAAAASAVLAAADAAAADVDRLAAAASAVTAAAQATSAAAQATAASSSATTATTQAGIATAQAVLADADRVSAAASAASALADAALADADRIAAAASAVLAAADAAAADADRIAAAASASTSEDARDAALVAQAAAEAAAATAVQTANSPAAGEFARFTDATHIEGLTGSEMGDLLGLDAALLNKINIAKVDRIDPRDTAFGGLVNGQSADAAQNGIALNLAIQAVLSDNLPLFIPPGRSMYVEAAAITTQFNESDVEIYGEGDSSRIVVTDNAPLFQIDAEAAERYRFNAREFAVDFTAATYNLTRLFKVNADAAVYGGLRASEFRSITCRGVYKMFDFEPTLLTDYGGIDQTPGYAFIKFTDIDIPQYSRYPERVVHFQSGHGPHTMITNSQLRADPTTGAAWESGDGAAMLGDFFMSGNHVVVGNYGIILNGPTNHLKYRTNNRIVGNQFDVMTTGIGWLKHLDGAAIDNAALYGTADDWRIEDSINIDHVDIGTSQGRYGLRGKTGLSNGTISLWKIAVSDTSETKVTMDVEVSLELNIGGLAARHTFRRSICSWNSGTPAVPVNILGPLGISTADLAINFTVNGAAIDVTATIANGTGSAGVITGNMTVLGHNRKVTYL